MTMTLDLQGVKDSKSKRNFKACPISRKCNPSIAKYFIGSTKEVLAKPRS